MSSINTQIILTIMEEMNNKVKSDLPIMPSEWVEAGLELESLAGDLDNYLAEQEAKILDEEIRLLEIGEEMTAARAKVLKTKVIDYASYLKMKALRRRIENFQQLAKKRASIRD